MAALIIDVTDLTSAIKFIKSQIAYYELIYQREYLQVQKEALDLARQQLTDDRTRVQLGNLAEDIAHRLLLHIGQLGEARGLVRRQHARRRGGESELDVDAAAV